MLHSGFAAAGIYGQGWAHFMAWARHCNKGRAEALELHAKLTAYIVRKRLHGHLADS